MQVVKESSTDLSAGLTTTKQPYISINKLAEYMSADAIRRRQIIVALKKDSDFTKVYYSELKNIIGTYFSSGYNATIITDTIAKIKAKTAITEWDKSDNGNTIAALECLIETDLPDLSDYDFGGGTEIKSVFLSGVTVTIKPDVFIRNKTTGKWGFVKIHIAKTEANRLGEENRIYAATLLKYGAIDKGLGEKEIDNSACISLDIFLKDYSTSATSYKRKIAALEAACEEIALRWDKV